MIKIYIEETEDIEEPKVKIENAEGGIDRWYAANMLLHAEINYMSTIFRASRLDAVATLFKAALDWLKDCGVDNEQLHEAIDAPSVFRKPTEKKQE